MQKIRAQTRIATAQLAASQGIDDLTLAVSGGLNRFAPDSVLGIEPQRSYGAQLQVSLDRLVSETGTRLSARYGNQFTSRTPGTAAVGASYYQPSLTLALTQPLLKNAGGIQDRLNISLNRQRAELARLLADEQLESYVTRLAALYLDWYLSQRELVISEEVYQQALAQEKLVRLKVKRQVAEPYELLRIQELREDFFARWQQAVGIYDGLGHQIQVQMQGDGQLQLSPLQPADPQAYPLWTMPPRDPSYLAVESRLKSVLDLLQALETIRLAALQDARKPALDLGMTYTRHGIDSNLGDAHSGSLDRNDVGVMLNYRYPLGNRSSTGAVASQRASSLQVAADTAQQMRDAQAALGNLLAQQTQLAVALQSAGRKVDLAARKLAEEQRLYEIGQLDLFELLQDHTAQLETRLGRERLEVQLYKIRLSIGELLDRNLDGLNVPSATVER